ncbi:GTP pyrophosphokinase [Lusitaniella coriacea]|uniref:GTP pyrophosphokinase n=1 Tax=Lusitaniella coriacea TaxID=1983105 RepID=UPI003CED1423
MANLQRALEIAIEGHKGQQQKNGLPYVLHPLRLMLAASSTEAKIVAVLHDVIEDTNWTLEALKAEGFSQSILTAIGCLTHRDGEEYDAYIERLIDNEIAREVKLMDLKDNMDIRRIPELKESDLKRLQKYHRARSRLTNYEA